MNILKNSIIVFLTDFGIDPYPGVMKGVILKINPNVKFISLSNHIQNHNIRHGAFILLKSYQYFPSNSIFLGIIDPGVGGIRKAIGVKFGDYYFIGPDNGLITPTIAENPDPTVVELKQTESASYTFHGRDVFAPAAALLSLNYSLETLGTLSNIQVQLNFHWDSNTSTGEVIFIDHFGNIITNILPSSKLIYGNEYLVSSPRIKKRMIFKRSYYEGSETEPFLLLNSFGTLEIALREGKATDFLDIQPKEKIQIC